MSSQISDLYIRKPSHVRRFGGLTATVLVASAVAIGTAAAWFFNRSREHPLADRTRNRLAPSTPISTVPTVIPNASDIHIS